MGLRTRRNLKRYAKSFRAKINDFVYRKGNGHEAQTWPLIRCVQLQGPWSVLKSGGVLVDLPGVRDANAARARVSERYLQNCNLIWVVAPIKRAVDDGTAKDLMGAEFKRRLLMDGQYGNVAFICTQTDDCEATEIMRDHEDIALMEEGRFEKMVDLRSKCNGIETELSNRKEEEEELKLAEEEAVELLKDFTQQLEDASAPPKRKRKRTSGMYNDDYDDDDDDFIIDDDEDDGTSSNADDVLEEKVYDENMIQELKDLIADQSKKVDDTKLDLSSWMSLHSDKIAELNSNSNRLQRRLKAMCAKVRNEYSTKCLKEDFVAGLKEIYRDSRDGGDAGDDENNDIAIPDNMSLPVFCISANDYLKCTGIKPISDGPPSCFTNPSDTQIQRLREFVHTMTATRREKFAESFVKRTSDLVDRVKLLANDASADGGGSTRQKVRCQNVFQGEMKSVAAEIEPIAEQFLQKAQQKVMTNLKPSLTSGARKAMSSAMTTVDSWGSKSRRSKQHGRSIDNNGLFWSTYNATARREGVYVSASAGSIDMNAELAAPMEAEYTPAWSSIMDGTIKRIIVESERQLEALCKQLDQSLMNGFCGVGIDKARIASMVTISSSTRTNAIRASFVSMRETAMENQRELSRSLLPKVQQSMKKSYDSTVGVPGGPGKFTRMKSAMHSTSHVAVNGLFDACMKELLDAIELMVQDLSGRISMLKESISTSLSSVYSILWEDQIGGRGRIIDPVHQRKVLACRVACLPILNVLRKKQDRIMKVLGIEPPVLDLEIVGGETWEQTNERKMQEAIAKGALINVDDDSNNDDDDNNNNSNESDKKRSSVKLETGSNTQRIKNERAHHGGGGKRGAKLNDTIDLLSDSDDDDDDVEQIIYVIAKKGSLGLSVDRDESITDGFLVYTVSSGSQLVGKVLVGDVITSIMGRRLSSTSTDELTTMLQVSSQLESRRICITRSTTRTMTMTKKNKSLSSL